jgi:hypothetical protein
MFDPYTDLSEVWKVIAGDATILSLKGLTGKPAVDIAKAIVKKNTIDNLAGKEMRMCIYFKPSRKARLAEVVTEEVLEIDVHVPSGNEATAMKIMSRVNKLLHKQDVNNKTLFFGGQLGDLATVPSFYCVGIRFTYNSLI